MSLPRLAPVLLALVTVLSAASASAQGTMTLRITAIEGSDWMMDGDSIGADDCNAESQVRLQVTGVTMAHTRLDLWRGSMCNVTTARSGDPADDCDHVPAMITGMGGPTQDLGPVALSTLFDCTGTEGDQTLWVVGGDSSPEDGDVGTHYAFTELDIDRTAPAAPAMLSGGRGDSAIPLDWDSPSGEVERYLLFVDPGGCAGDGGTSSLMAGGAAPSGGRDLGSATSATVSGADIGLAVGESAAIAIAAEDRAGNLSVLSNVECITRVDTMGFWTGDAEQCSVSAATGARRASGGLLSGLALLGAAALVLGRRRR